MDDTIKITYCARCNNLYVKIRFNVCDHCIDDEEADYQKICDVLAENAGQSTEAVVLLADVEVATVLRMLEQGLIVNDNLAHDFKCGRCGGPAISGAQRLCRTCLNKLDQTFFKEIVEAKIILAEQRRESVHEVLMGKRKKSPGTKRK
ncbi:MAG: hypothetical protein VCD00_21160 [Candidatus Hydrogenedentota bacterium]